MENCSVHGVCSSFVADVGHQAYELSELERVNNGKEKVDVGIPQYGLHSTWMSDGSNSSPRVNFAENVCPFRMGQVVLDFENSTVSMPSAERDLRKSVVFNDGSSLGLNAVNVPLTFFGTKEGYIYGGPLLWEAMRTTNASNIGFHDEDMSSSHFPGRKQRRSES
ncbi:hypothetical protein Tco_0994294 [Tanacetum coccineum]